MNLRAHVSFALTESIWLISHSNRFPPGLALAQPIRSVYLKRGGLFSVNTVVCLHFSSADCYLSLCFALTVCRVCPLIMLQAELRGSRLISICTLTSQCQHPAPIFKTSVFINNQIHQMLRCFVRIAASIWCLFVPEKVKN